MAQKRRVDSDETPTPMDTTPMDATRIDATRMKDPT